MKLYDNHGDALAHAVKINSSGAMPSGFSLVAAAWPLGSVNGSRKGFACYYMPVNLLLRAILKDHDRRSWLPLG